MKTWPRQIGRIEITEDDRRAVAAWYGGSGMATLAEVVRFVYAHGTEGLDDAIRSMEGVTPVERSE